MDNLIFSKKILLSLLLIATFIMSVGYASINLIVLDVNGKVSANKQDGVFITDVVYNSGDDGSSNSKINNFYQTMMNSHIVLDLNNIDSTVSYKIKVYNGTNKDYVYINPTVDKNNPLYYNNLDIEFIIDGLVPNETVIASGEEIEFVITYKYVDGINITNNTLDNIINFKFKEIPIVDFNIKSDDYILEDVYPDFEPKEYEFTISNYTKDSVNGVNTKYRFDVDVSKPLNAKIFDSLGNEVVGEIDLIGNNTDYVNNDYVLKIFWDDSNPEEGILYNDYTYSGREYFCNINFVAVANDLSYDTFSINKKIDINISSAEFNFNVNVPNSVGAEKTSSPLPISINNYNENSIYNSYDTNYEISIFGNNKFTPTISSVSSNNNVFSRKLEGNSKIVDNFNVDLAADIYSLSTNEIVNVKIKSTYPYVMEKDYVVSVNLQPLNVRFDANGGSVTSNGLSTYKGRTYGELPTPTWVGHTFNGWYTKASGGDKVVSSTEATISNVTQTLFAQWTSRLLSDKAKPGDLVNYNVGYSNVTITFNSTNINAASGYTGWKVLDVVGSGDSKYILLISSGVPLSFKCPRSTTDTTNGSKCQTALTKNFFSTPINSTLTNYNFYKNGFTGVTTIGGLKNVFLNNIYTKLDSSNNPIVRASTKEDIDGSLAWSAEINGTSPLVIENLTDFRNNTLFGIKSTSTSYAYVPWYIATVQDSYYLWNSYLSGYVVYTADAAAFGIRPVVALKATTETTGQSNGVWQLSAVSE